MKAYSLGVDWHFDDVEGGLFIATLEKALCDKIRYEWGLGSLTQEQMLEYLEDDLRAELPADINISLIESIATAYRSKNLATLATLLRKTTMTHPAIINMLGRYDLSTAHSSYDALREILQEIV